MKHIPIKCSKCKKLVDGVWPLGKGVCDKCLVKNYSLDQALKATCPCLHEDVKKLYERKGG